MRVAVAVVDEAVLAFRVSSVMDFFYPMDRLNHELYQLNFSLAGPAEYFNNFVPMFIYNRKDRAEGEDTAY